MDLFYKFACIFTILTILSSAIKDTSLPLWAILLFLISYCIFIHYHLFPSPQNAISPYAWVLFALCSIPPHPNLPHKRCQPALYLWVCFYFACWFSLLIRFHMWVKSYGTCLSLTGFWKVFVQQGKPSKSKSKYNPRNGRTCLPIHMLRVLYPNVIKNLQNSTPKKQKSNLKKWE